MQRRADSSGPRIQNLRPLGCNHSTALTPRFAEMRSLHFGILPHDPEPYSNPGFRNLKVTSKGVGSYPCSIWASGVLRGWRHTTEGLLQIKSSDILHVRASSNSSTPKSFLYKPCSPCLYPDFLACETTTFQVCFEPSANMNEKSITGNGLSREATREETLEHIKSAGMLTLSPELFEKLYLQPQTAVKGDLRKILGNPTPL